MCVANSDRQRERAGDSQTVSRSLMSASALVSARFLLILGECPRQDSNLRTRLRRPLLYPLSYGGVSAAELLARGDGQNTTSSLGVFMNGFPGAGEEVAAPQGWKWGKPGRGSRSGPTL